MELFGLRNIKTGEMIKFSSTAVSTGGYAVQKIRLSSEGENVWISTNESISNKIASIKNIDDVVEPYSSTFENPLIPMDLIGNIESIKIKM